MNDGTLQYLELQSADVNGFKNFTRETLARRFGCEYSRGYKLPAYLIEVESLGKSKEFIELMQYTNTAKTLQRIGAGGYAK